MPYVVLQGICAGVLASTAVFLCLGVAALALLTIWELLQWKKGR